MHAESTHKQIRNKHVTTHHDPSVEENRNFGATEIRHMELANRSSCCSEAILGTDGGTTTPRAVSNGANDFGPNFSRNTIPDQNTNAGAHPGRNVRLERRGDHTRPSPRNCRSNIEKS